jgi:hypothetical protein
MWVHGDQSGAVLCVQLETHEPGQGLLDHYVVLDYKGWRYIQFVEPEGDRVYHYPWPDIGNYVNDKIRLRPPAKYTKLKHINLLLGNLPPNKKNVTCYVSRIEALKEKSTGYIKKPTLKVDAMIGKDVKYQYDVTIPTIINLDEVLTLDALGHWEIRDKYSHTTGKQGTVVNPSVLPIPYLNRIRFNFKKLKYSPYATAKIVLMVEKE